MDSNNSTANGTFDISSLLETDTTSDFEMVLKYLFYVLSMVVAFCGNITVIVVILRMKSLRTKFNLYVVNLAAADVLMPTFCMWIHLVNSLNRYWVLGEFLCKVHTFIQVTVVCASIFTLSTVTIDRFLATVFPSRLWITQRFQPVIILLIWLMSLGIALPWVLYQLYAEFDWIFGHEVVCQSKFPSVHARKVYYVTFFSIVFLIPLVLMFVLVVVTVIKADNARRPDQSDLVAYSSNEMHHKAMYFLLTVLVVFCVCWAPQQSLLLWDVYRKRYEKMSDLKQLHYMSLYMAYTSSAINPVVYFLYNKCFRHAISHLWKTKCRGGDPIATITPGNIEMTISSDTRAIDSSDMVVCSVSSGDLSSGDLTTIRSSNSPSGSVESE